MLSPLWRCCWRLLLRDGDNPRGFVACLQRIAEHVADVGWQRGGEAVSELVTIVTRATADELASPAFLDAVGAAVGEFAAEVIATWFATPVKPMLMRAGRAALS